MTTTKKTTTRKRASTTKKVTATKPKAKAAPQKVPDLPKNPFAYEVLGAASKMRSNAKKVEVLQRYGDPSLKAVLIWNFDETIVTLLPQGDVPYGNNKDDANTTGSLTDKISDAVDKMGELRTTSLGSQDQGQTSIRRESMFIDMLQGLHPLEAEILCLIKDSRLTDKYKITKENVSEAYPDITWGGRG